MKFGAINSDLITLYPLFVRLLLYAFICLEHEENLLYWVDLLVLHSTIITSLLPRLINISTLSLVVFTLALNSSSTLKPKSDSNFFVTSSYFIPICSG